MRHVRFFITFVFCLLAIISCQKNQENSEVLRGEKKISIASKWAAATIFTVENVKSRTAELHVETVGYDEGGKARCEIVTTEPDKAARYFPLPIKFYAPYAKDHKVSKEFEQTLSYSKHKVASDRVQFIVDFKKGEFEFSSLWKLEPYSTTDMGGNSICATSAEVCLRYEEKDGEMVCKNDFRWMKELVVIPDTYAYIFRGGAEVVSAIKGIFWNKQENGTYVASEPEQLN